jgi:murein DD-endopeptidase MepM/ murein hydrolase activator NlpD
VRSRARAALAGASAALLSVALAPAPEAATATSMATSMATSVPHAFPVTPPVVASYGRSHHDYPATDVFAPCGAEVVSPVDGVVEETSATDRWRPEQNDGATRGGLSWSIVGDDGVRYYGSHLRHLEPRVVPGARLLAGQRVGSVGSTGDARGVACHLHFGLSPPRCVAGDWWTRRGAIAPWPFLDDWRRGGSRSPRSAAEAWRAAHPCARDRAPA